MTLRQRLRGIPLRTVLLLALTMATVNLFHSMALGTDDAVLKPRVPADQIEQAKSWRNPLSPTQESLERGKQLFQGKAFCITCHGRDGKGLGADIEPGTLKGPLPRNFTDRDWQAARTDGELFWILKNGSKGTAMAPFIPLILTEEEAWLVLLHVRSFVQSKDTPAE